MSDTPETLSAVIEYIRYRANNYRHDGWESVAEELEDLSDRIDAAVVRERDEDRQLAAIAESDEAFARCARCDRPERAPVNAAAMRAALMKCNELFRCDDDNKSRLCHLARKADEAVQAAIAAPARNCDRFRTLDDFSMADSPIDTPLTNATREQLYKVIRWLFAPSKKGGGHA